MVDKICDYLTNKIRQQMPEVDDEKAEVINYQELLDQGSIAAAKEKGLVRVEGKEYVMQDGDVVLFRFNV